MLQQFGRALLLGFLFATSIDDPLSAQDAAAELRYGAWGLDLTATDKSISPGDDFFNFSNGTWLQQTVIPSDKSRITLRTLMTDRTREHLHALLETAARNARPTPNETSGMLGAFYKAFMNEELVEALGAKPVMSMLTDIQAATLRQALGTNMANSTRDFTSCCSSSFRVMRTPKSWINTLCTSIKVGSGFPIETTT